MTQKGILIVIDGIDGSGKSTQTKLLVEHLRAQGRSVETLRFPQYETFFGQMIRSYLNGNYGEPTQTDPYLASTLYAMNRWELREQLTNWLNAGSIVILDRYITSNLLLQGGHFPPEQIDTYINWLYQMEFEVLKIPKPDHVLFLHVPAQVSMDLIKSRGQGFDGLEKIEHLKKAEAIGLYLSEKLNWQTIECTQDNSLLSIEQVHEKIKETIAPLLPIIDKTGKQ